jgi:hypothetical protein
LGFHGVAPYFCSPSAGKKKFRTTNNGDAELSGQMVPFFQAGRSSDSRINPPPRLPALRQWLCYGVGPRSQRRPNVTESHRLPYSPANSEEEAGTGLVMFFSLVGILCPTKESI